MGVRAVSKITITFGNEHVAALTPDGLPQGTFTLKPGPLTDIPDWVTKHPHWAVVTKDYKDVYGVEREADVVVVDDPKDFSFRRPDSIEPAQPVSGTNVSDNPAAGKPLKGASRKGEQADAVDSLPVVTAPNPVR